MRRYIGLFLAFVLLWPCLSDAAWVAAPGTIKLYVRKKPRRSSDSTSPQLPVDRLKAIHAEVVDDQDTFAVLQLPIPNASAAPQILGSIADVTELRDELDFVQFRDYPIDARYGPPEYPSEWGRTVPLSSPARDAFVLQFATAPRPGWLEDLNAAGVTVIDYIPQNAYAVLGDQTALRAFADRAPVQLLRPHQPIHRVSQRAREWPEPFVDAVVSIAKVPEAEDAVSFLRAHSIASRQPAQNGGNRNYYFPTIDTASLPQLAAFPAVIYIDVESEVTPSGEREAHLTVGDTLSTTAGGYLHAAAGDIRAWIISKGLSNYKTSLKIAILDTGFDLGDSANVHADFRDSSSGASFVTVRDYTSAQGSDADCYGHGTMVAGVISGNAGGPNSTSDVDAGATHGDSNFLMGQGIAPELPIVVGRIFNNISGVTPSGKDFPNPLGAYTELSGMGVRIANNSWNDPTVRSYSKDSRTLDMLVRSANGQNGGPQMAIYCSAGNAEGQGASNPYVSSPATAKNVTSVGASKNYNQNSYSDLWNVGGSYPTAGISADNANQVWPVSQHPPTIEGRHKPDLLAPGTGIESARSRSTDLCQTPTAVGSAIPNDTGTHRWSRGTSFASPLAAGAGALIYTWFKNQPGMSNGPTPALLKAAQITLASELPVPGSHPPDDVQGWGRVDLTRAFATDGRYAWQDESNIFTASGGPSALLPSPGSGYRIKDTTKPVRVTLVWTDAPALENASPALSNNLDLTVRFQDFAGAGRYSIGNDFDLSTGRTRVLSSGGTYDTINNVEQVVFTFADASTDHFQVEVFPRVVSADAINVWAQSSPKQNFAVFLENAVAYSNNSSFLNQQILPSTTVPAGSTLSGYMELLNTGDTTWTEGSTYFYRLGSIVTGNPFGSRLTVPGSVGNNSIGHFSFSVKAPYAGGPYSFQWQMVEDPSLFFGAMTPSTAITVTPSPYSFNPLTPCRIMDTRGNGFTGPYGPPSLANGAPRTVILTGHCGIPSTATAVSINITAVSPSGPGFLKVYPSNIASPTVSTLNYNSGKTRANNAFVSLDTSGQVTIGSSAVTTDVLLDVNGYFQ
jgi:subtilase family protein